MSETKCPQCGRTCIDDDKFKDGKRIKEADSTLKDWLNKTKKMIEKIPKETL